MRLERERQTKIDRGERGEEAKLQRSEEPHGTKKKKEKEEEKKQETARRKGEKREREKEQEIKKIEEGRRSGYGGSG